MKRSGAGKAVLDEAAIAASRSFLSPSLSDWNQQDDRYQRQERSHDGWSAGIYEPSPEQEAEQQAARQRKELGLDLRSTADRIAWPKQQVAQEEKLEWIELGGRDLTLRRGRWWRP